MKSKLYKLIFVLNREKYVFAASLLFGIAVSFFAAVYSYSNEIGGEISDSVLRLHILANSDDERDQELKLLVRDAILDEFGEKLDMLSSKEEAMDFLAEQTDRIKHCAEKTLGENGCAYGVDVRLENEKFPTKNYGGISLPAGNYQAVRVIIGEGGGQNWWCMLFPPMCFIDITKAEVSSQSRETLKSSMSDEAYSVIAESDRSIKLKLKFKIIELWQSRKS